MVAFIQGKWMFLGKNSELCGVFNVSYTHLPLPSFLVALETNKQQSQ